jgi:LysR family transcriptional regulator for bpeEF and oprC
MSQFWSPAHMATFAKIIDLNGFSAAARALGVPKAAVSRAIAELEDELGVKLMTRTTRRLKLTPAGERLLPACRAILQSTDDARRLAAELIESRGGPLRVLAEPTFGRVLLAPLVPRFLERYPKITLDVELGDLSSELPAEHDLVIRVGEDPSSDRVSRVLGAPPAILCATPTYLQKAGEPATPADLARFDMLTPETPPGSLFVLRLTNGKRREEVSVSPKLAVNDPALLHASVAAGLGIGLLPEFLCRQGLASQRLKKVLPDWRPPEQAPLCAVYPGRLAEDERVKAFVDFLAANLVPALAG